jgi:hypothetical protein
MSDQRQHSKTRPCPAYRDRAFVAANIAVWASGAFGIYWMSERPVVGATVSAAYLAVNIVFFWGIFSRVVCPACAYHYPDLSREEYFSQHKDRFLRTLRTWYKVWLVIGWGWPVVVMIAAYVVSRSPVVLASLAAFLIVSFGAWLPVVRLRVCSRCTVRELGICPVYMRGEAEGA